MLNDNHIGLTDYEASFLRLLEKVTDGCVIDINETVKATVKNKVWNEENVDAPIGMYCGLYEGTNLHIKKKDFRQWHNLAKPIQESRLAHSQINDAVRVLTYDIKNTQQFARCLYEMVSSSEKALQATGKAKADIADGAQ